MSNSNELTERIQYNEASISIPNTSKNTEHTPEDLTKKDVIEEDKTYAKSVLGTAEETSGVEQKVRDVRWNFDNYQFVFDLREIANHAVLRQSSMIQWDSCHPSLYISKCSSKNFARRKLAEISF